MSSPNMFVLARRPFFRPEILSVFRLSPASLFGLTFLFSNVFAEEERLSPQVAKETFGVTPSSGEELKLPDHTTFAPLIRKVKPSVVSIFSAIHVSEDTNTPLDRFFGESEEDESSPGERPMGSGSGVILSEAGWIVTNSHVVHLPSGQLADAIKVQLHDRRRFPADIVGVDPKTDLALLKIEASDLVALPIGLSAQVSEGDLVFAVGNPFRVGMTATMGMVSATRRSSLNFNGPGGYESFIQTDAAINPGNSGGALVSAKGHLIGINTAIYGGIGGNVGIGFAIPTDLMRPVLVALATEGKVTRGFWGLVTEEVDEESAENAQLFQIRGAKVTETMAGGPAEKGGLQVGDIILRCNSAEVATRGDLRIALSIIPPLGRADLAVRRNGKTSELSIFAIKDPSDIGQEVHFRIEGFAGMKFVIREESIVIDDLEAPARRMGFERGMTLISVNGKEISSAVEAEEALVKGVNKIVTTHGRQNVTLALRVQ